mgnify:CR=1 FL=1
MLEHLSSDNYDIISSVLQMDHDLFDKKGRLDIGCNSKVQHEINTGPVKPFKKNPYRLAHALKPVVAEQIQDMLKKGIIVESASPWNHPIVMVKKKSRDGTPKYRLCVDL